jgi:hypothetical protein
MKRSSQKRKNHGVAGTLPGVLLLGAFLVAGFPAWGYGSKEDEKSAITTETMEGPGGSTTMVSEFSVTMPEELPNRRPEAMGNIKELTDAGFVIFEPNITMSGNTGTLSGGGTEYEIVVTKDTIFYDISETFTTGKATAKEGSLEKIAIRNDISSSFSFVEVWGRKTGERIIAEIVAYVNHETPAH